MKSSRFTSAALPSGFAVSGWSRALDHDFARIPADRTTDCSRFRSGVLPLLIVPDGGVGNQPIGGFSARLATGAISVFRTTIDSNRHVISSFLTRGRLVGIEAQQGCQFARKRRASGRL